jgi:hypothetical protein
LTVWLAGRQSVRASGGWPAASEEEVVDMPGWMGEPNRVADAITDVASRLEDIPETRQFAMRKGFTMDSTELAVFQQWKSLAQAEGLLTLDEAMTIYTALGDLDAVRDIYGWPIDTSLAQRTVVLKLMTEIGPAVMSR